MLYEVSRLSGRACSCTSHFYLKQWQLNMDRIQQMCEFQTCAKWNLELGISTYIFWKPMKGGVLLPLGSRLDSSDDGEPPKTVEISRLQYLCILHFNVWVWYQTKRASIWIYNLRPRVISLPYEKVGYKPPLPKKKKYHFQLLSYNKLWGENNFLGQFPKKLIHTLDGAAIWTALSTTI